MDTTAVLRPPSVLSSGKQAANSSPDAPASDRDAATDLADAKYPIDSVHDSASDEKRADTGDEEHVPVQDDSKDTDEAQPVDDAEQQQQPERSYEEYEDHDAVNATTDVDGSVPVESQPIDAALSQLQRSLSRVDGTVEHANTDDAVLVEDEAVESNDASHHSTSDHEDADVLVPDDNAAQVMFLQSEEDDDDQDNLREMIKNAEIEQASLMRINRELYKRTLLLWERDPSGNRMKTDEKSRQHKGGIAQEQLKAQYGKSVEQLMRLVDSIAERKRFFEEKIERLTGKLDTQDEKATELCDSFKLFKREIARGAEFSRSGKPIKLKRILALEAAEEDKDKEVEAVRLKNIHYLNQLEKLEQELKQKEELAEGLHLIDFEQLKIENQALNEKIEERNDELHKLRKKTTATVQVLTHLKEKLTCVKSENGTLREQLETVDAELLELRDRLTKAKHEKDALRARNNALKAQQGFTGSDLLVADYEKRKEEMKHLKEQVLRLRARHADLTAAIALSSTSTAGRAQTLNVHNSSAAASKAKPSLAYGTAGF